MKFDPALKYVAAAVLADSIILLASPASALPTLVRRILSRVSFRLVHPAHFVPTVAHAEQLSLGTKS